MFLLTATLLWAGTALAADAAVNCQAAKNKAAGKLSSCLQKTAARYIKTDDAEKYAAGVKKCNDKFFDKWAKEETKAGACPDEPLDSNSLSEFIIEHSDVVAAALGGEELPLGVETCNSYLSTRQAKGRVIIFDSGVSSTGALGGRAATTAACDAAKPPYMYCPNGVLAMLSYSGGDDVASMPSNYTDFPDDFPIVAGPDLVQVASDWADFLDGSWEACLSDNCSGAETAAAVYTGMAMVWTGTLHDGTVSTDNCNNWTVSGSASGLRLQTNWTAAGTFWNGALTCSGTLGMACFCY